MKHPVSGGLNFVLVRTALLAGILASPRPGALTRGRSLPSVDSDGRDQLAYIGADGNVYMFDAERDPASICSGRRM